MRLIDTAARLALLPAAFALTCGAASAATHHAKPTAQQVHCDGTAKEQNLTGKARTDFIKTCMKGPMQPETPTAPTAQSKEAQAVTKPSGVDRTTRSKQCGAEADKKGLSGKQRSEFQLSCLATAGPVSETQSGATTPHPANQIKGIGVNNYKPSATTAKSTPTKPQP